MNASFAESLTEFATDDVGNDEFPISLNVPINCPPVLGIRSEGIPHSWVAE
jgi:hypothetical protein